MSGYADLRRLHQGGGEAGRMGARMMADVAEGERGRVYLPPTPRWKPSRAGASPNGSHGDLPARLSAWILRDLRNDKMERPLHFSPARGADDVLRPGAGSTGASKAGRLSAGLADDGQSSRRRRHRRDSIRRCRGVILGACRSRQRPRTTQSALVSIWRNPQQDQRDASSGCICATGTADDLGLRRGQSVQRIRRRTFSTLSMDREGP